MLRKKIIFLHSKLPAISKMIWVADLLKTISDSSSLELFKMVALAKPGVAILISETKLSRKQYYSRMSKLKKVGLIKRIKGEYTLTAFGKLIYYTALATMENAVNNYWKLEAIDSLEMSDNLPAEERKKIIDTLVDNQQIKAILVSDISKFKSTRPHAAESLQKANAPIKIGAVSVII
jgi:hypothetical protein